MLTIPYWTDSSNPVYDDDDDALYLMQAIVPKELYTFDTVVWDYNGAIPSTETTPVYAIDAIEATTSFYQFIYPKYWSTTPSSSSRILAKSVDDLQSYLEKFASETDIETYLAKYDEAFFEENTLALAAVYQSCGEEIQYQLDGAQESASGKLLYLYYSDTYEEGVTYADVQTPLLIQVILPREEYPISSVSWEYTNNHENFEILRVIEVDMYSEDTPKTIRGLFKAECSGDIRIKATMRNVYGIDWMTTNHTRRVGAPVDIEFDDDVSNPRFTIQYDDTALEESGVSEEDLVVLYYCNDGFQWFPEIPAIQWDTENNMITFQTLTTLSLEYLPGIYLLVEDS
ncbi:MAG: hypothetical protein LIO74_04715 [Ruminococcus sp.]|nr:hypothetical protein [Ruminococcus sp.]